MLHSMHMRLDLYVLSIMQRRCCANGCPAVRHNGFGRHIYVLDNPLAKQREFIKILYVYEIGYYSSTSAVKIAM